MLGLYFTWSALKYLVVSGLFAGILALCLRNKVSRKVYIAVAIAYLAMIASSLNTGSTVYKADKSAWNPPVLKSEIVEKQVDRKAKAEDNFNATLEKLEAKNP